MIVPYHHSHLLPARLFILATSRLDLSPTCQYHLLSSISTAALLQSLAFTAAMSFLKLSNRGLPRLNIMLARILCTSSGKVPKVGKTVLQSARVLLTSRVKRSHTLASVTLLPTGFPCSGSLGTTRWPMPTTLCPKASV